MAADVTCGAVDPLSGAVCTMASDHAQTPAYDRSHIDGSDPQVMVQWSERSRRQPPDPERRRCWRRRGQTADGQASVCDRLADTEVGLCRRCRDEMEAGE